MQPSDGAGSAPAQPNGDGGQLSEVDARFQRTMKIVVAALGFLVIAALTAVVVRVIYLASRPTAQPSAPTVPAEEVRPAVPMTDAVAPSRAIRPSQRLALPPGAVVRSVALSGDRLAVHYETGGKPGVAILDLKTGRRVTTVEIEEEAADK